MQRLPIEQSKVNELIRQCKHLNVFPIQLPVYYRGESQPNPVTSLLADLVPECIEYLSAMTKDEIGHLVGTLPSGTRVLLDFDTVTGGGFSLERVALCYLVAVVQESYWPFRQIVSSDIGNSELLQIYPEIHDKLDEDGLLYLDDNFQPFDGGIAYKDHVIHYHQFLRRGFTSNPNFDFLGRFVGYFLQTKQTNRFRVAIDFYRLMPKEFLRHIVEMDTWFGARFERSRLDDPNAVGLTVVKRVKPSIFDTINNLDRTEFFWAVKNRVKSLEIEEVSVLPITK